MEITEENIHIVCRQTNYTEDESKQKLILHQNDPMKVIKEYMDFHKKDEPKLNSNIYSEIRTFMKTSYEQRPPNLKI